MRSNQERMLSWSLVFLLAAITTIAVILLLSFVPNPLDMDRIKQEYISTLAVSSYFRVENSEKLQYVLGTVVFFLSFLCYGLVLKDRPLNCDADSIVRILKPLPLVITVILLIYTLRSKPMYIAALSQDKFDFLLLGSLSVYLLISSLRIYSCLHNKRPIDLACFFILLCFGAVILYFWRVHSYWGYDSSNDHHVNAYFYPIYQVWCGNTPGIEFRNLYGFYPYLLVPFLHLAGGISDLNLSTVLACMIILSLFSIYRFLAYTTHNRILALFGSCSAIYLVTFYPANYQRPFFLQYTPHRLFFPAVSLLVVTFLDKKIQTLDLSRRKTWLHPQILGVYVFAAMALFWNIESGIAVLISFSGYMAYCLACQYSLKDSFLWWGLLRIFLLSIFSVSLAYGSAVAISMIRTGQFLTPSDALYGILRFAGDGFYMLPLPLKHPWILAVGLYAAVAARSMTRLKMFHPESNSPDYSCALPFFLSVLGILVFLYYQGRSHDYVFPFVSWPAFILLAFMKPSSLQAVKQMASIDRVLHQLTCLIRLVFLVVPLMCMVLGIVQGNKLTGLKKAHQALEDGGNVAIRTQFIQNTLDEDSIQSLDIIASYGSAINRSLGITDILPIGAPVDWFLYEDVENALNTIAQSEKEYLFWETGLLNSVSQFCPETFDKVMSRYELYITDSKGASIFHRIS